MKKILFSLLIVIFLCGCENIYSLKVSELKEEMAEVISMNYIPRNTNVSLNPGITMDGDLAFTMSSHTYPETWVVVFKCSEHNSTFGIVSRELFSKVKIGETVTLKYIEQIRYYPYAKNEPYKSAQEVIDYHTKQIIIRESIIER